MRAIGARLLAVISLAALTASCQISRGQPGVLIATTPPGAAITIDGADSGYVTPAAIYLPRTDWHRIDLHLHGYAPATRVVGPGTQTSVVPWTSGWIGVETWWFPLWLEIQHIALPVRVDDDLQPSRIHVRMRLLEGRDLREQEALEAQPLDPSEGPSLPEAGLEDAPGLTGLPGGPGSPRG